MKSLALCARRKSNPSNTGMGGCGSVAVRSSTIRPASTSQEGDKQRATLKPTRKPTHARTDVQNRHVWQDPEPPEPGSFFVCAKCPTNPVAGQDGQMTGARPASPALQGNPALWAGRFTKSPAGWTGLLAEGRRKEGGRRPFGLFLLVFLACSLA
jgi:hypothetical protein